MYWVVQCIYNNSLEIEQVFIIINICDFHYKEYRKPAAYSQQRDNNKMRKDNYTTITRKVSRTI